MSHRILILSGLLCVFGCDTNEGDSQDLASRNAEASVKKSDPSPETDIDDLNLCQVFETSGSSDKLVLGGMHRAVPSGLRTSTSKPPSIWQTEAQRWLMSKR